MPRCSTDLFGKSRPVFRGNLEEVFFELHAPLHQTMKVLSTSFNEMSVPPSGRMSLKLIRIERLKQLAALRGIEGTTDLGLLIGKKANQTSDLLSGKASFGEKVARSIEESAQLPRNWLDTLDIDKNVSVGPVLHGVVPLLSDVQAGMYKEFIDNYHPGDGGMELIPTSVPIKAHTFALRVTGDSMEPEFREGMIIIIEPEMDPQPGDYVIAKNGGEETTFKQLAKDGADWYLKPLNPRYPIKPLGDCRIIGVVRAVEKRYR